MFLNMPSKNSKVNCKNRVLDEIGGNAIMLFGHTRKQFDERVGKLLKLTNVKGLKYQNIVNVAQEAIKRDHVKCLIRYSNEKRRDHNVKFELKVNTENGQFIVDTIMLVKSTFVEYHEDYAEVPAPEYMKYANGLLALGKKVIAMETCVARIRIPGEKDTSPISDLGPNIETVNLGTVELANADFRNAVKYLLNEKSKKTGFYTGCTDAAREQIYAEPQEELMLAAFARHCNSRKVRR